MHKRTRQNCSKSTENISWHTQNLILKPASYITAWWQGQAAEIDIIRVQDLAAAYLIAQGCPEQPAEVNIMKWSSLIRI